MANDESAGHIGGSTTDHSRKVFQNSLFSARTRATG